MTNYKNELYNDKESIEENNIDDMYKTIPHFCHLQINELYKDAKEVYMTGSETYNDIPGAYEPKTSSVTDTTGYDFELDSLDSLEPPLFKLFIS